jgi:surface antigen
MRAVLTQSLVWGAFFVSGLIVFTKPSAAANCVLYARAETGVALFGDAGGWWDQANGRYQRGHAPAAGAILVFKRTQRIRSGHVAVVAKVISANEILVDHANWYRGRVSRGMSVIDTSPGHDWTSVAVIDLRSGTHGRDYPTYGFVYLGASPREIVEARDNGQHDAYVVDGWESLDFSAQPALLHVAFADKGWQLGVHRATPTRGNQHRMAAVRHLGHKGSTAHAHSHGISHAELVSPSRASHAIAPAAHALGAYTALARLPTPLVKAA